MARTDDVAEASLAWIFARIMLGTAIAAKTKMIATTIRSSISENPRSRILSPSTGSTKESLTREIVVSGTDEICSEANLGEGRRHYNNKQSEKETFRKDES